MVYQSNTVFDRFFYSFPREDPKPPISVEAVKDEEGKVYAAQIQFAVAGFEEEDLQVYFEGRTLVIEGDNVSHRSVSDKFKCSFTRKISLKENLDIKNTDITLKNGILNILLPINGPEESRTYILGGDTQP